jgi:hypothetical protein
MMMTVPSNKRSDLSPWFAMMMAVPWNKRSDLSPCLL